MAKAPARLIAPVAVIRSHSLPAAPETLARSTRILAPAFSVSVPTVRLVQVVVALVGSTVPPVTARLPTRVELFRKQFVVSVTGEFDSDPLTIRVLAPVTTVPPVSGLWPESVSVPPALVMTPAPLMTPA